MSQDEQNSTNAAQSESPEFSSSVTQPSNSKQTLSPLKAISVRILRGTIQTLEGVVEKLEEPTQTQPSQRPTRRRGFFARFGRNPIVLGAFVALGVLLFWVTSTFLTPNPVEVAVTPEPASEVTPFPELPEASTGEPEAASPLEPQAEIIPEPEQAPVEEEPSETVVTDVTEVPAPEPAPEPSPEPIPTPAPEPAPEPSPEPIPMPSPEPEPTSEPEVVAPPEVELTPEQRLIASIQGEVVEVSNQYVTGLVESIQPNFRSSRLVVRVSDRWYFLSPKLQDQIANEVFARSQQLDFSKLELTDSQGRLVARNPVVGSTMVILKRKANAQTMV